jgi:hypothetical protein
MMYFVDFFVLYFLVVIFWNFFLGWWGRRLILLGAIGCFRPIIFWCTKLTWHVIIGGQKITLLCQDFDRSLLVHTYYWVSFT